MSLRTNAQGSRLRKSTMHEMGLKVLYRMFLSRRPILIKTICLRSYGLTGGSSRSTFGTHHGPIKIIRHRRNASTSGLDPSTLCIHRCPLPLTYVAIINRCCSSHYCWSRRRHLGHLDFMSPCPFASASPRSLRGSAYPAWALLPALRHRRRTQKRHAPPYERDAYQSAVEREVRRSTRLLTCPPPLGGEGSVLDSVVACGRTSAPHSPPTAGWRGVRPRLRRRMRSYEWEAYQAHRRR